MTCKWAKQCMSLNIACTEFLKRCSLQGHRAGTACAVCFPIIVVRLGCFVSALTQRCVLGCHLEGWNVERGLDCSVNMICCEFDVWHDVKKQKDLVQDIYKDPGESRECTDCSFCWRHKALHLGPVFGKRAEKQNRLKYPAIYHQKYMGLLAGYLRTTCVPFRSYWSCFQDRNKHEYNEHQFSEWTHVSKHQDDFWTCCPQERTFEVRSIQTIYEGIDVDVLQ